VAIEAKQYAKALFDIAREKDSLDENKVALKKLLGYFDEVEELWPFMLNISINKQAKKDVMTKALGDSASRIFINFIKVLIDKDAIKFLPDVDKNYNKLYNEHYNIIEIKVTSALALCDDDIQAIRDRYKKKFEGFDVEVLNVVDKNIIGGIKIEYKDRVVDATFKTKLMKLREHIR